ncbi:hypothetical protein [Kosakonia sacchari]|uniref:hypothetical protein n=1 Tax=Kosakonia sacchari TaxID=1158459 RepID=UPI001361F710|nr:hypothetical protein [Kosakonia sacchari]QHM96546.1 hypothetical protein FGE25_20770 [Kosakonia sacchari]
MFIESSPDELELMAFFENSPVCLDKDAVSFLYEYSDDYGCCIQFSYSIAAGWIKYNIISGQHENAHSYIDGVSSFSIKNDKSGEYLYAENSHREFLTRIEVRIKPHVVVNSSVLIM